VLLSALSLRRNLLWHRRRGQELSTARLLCAHPTNTVLSDVWYFAKRVTLAIKLSGDERRGFGRVGAAAAPASSTTAGSILRTTPPNERCGAAVGGITGPPPVQMPAAIAPRPYRNAQRDQLTLAKSEVTVGRLEIERLTRAPRTEA
jgi:hypothetical protein